MIIKKLGIMSFGKFNNEIINFYDGINVVYGENEGGKSTIHKFIEAMFFGFFKDQKSKKIYSDDYSKYLPFAGDNYGGYIIYEQNNREIRLERNLLKGKDRVIIYDNITGENITKNFEYDKVLRLPVPFNVSAMNRTIYNNTINIPQLGNTTEGELINQLKDRVANYGESRTDISIKNTLKTLTIAKNALGTEKRKGSPLYVANRRKEELLEEKKVSIENEQKIRELLKEKDEIKKYIDKNILQRNNLIKNKEALECQKAADKINRYSKLQGENNDYHEQLYKIELREVNKDDHNTINNYENKIIILNEYIDEINDRISHTQKEIKEIESNHIDNNIHSTSALLHEQQQLQYYRNEKTNLLFEKENLHIHLLQDKIAGKKSKEKSSNIYKIGSFLIGVLGIILGIWQWMFFVLSAMFIIFGYLVIKSNQEKEQLKRDVDELSKLLEKEKIINQQIHLFDNKIVEIFNKYNCSDYQQFISFSMDMQRKSESIELIQRQLVSLKDREKNDLNDLKENNEKIQAIQNATNSLLEKNNVASKEELYQLISNREKSELINNKIRQNILLMESIISTNDYDSVKKQGDDLQRLKPWLNILDKTELEEALRKMDKIIEENSSKGSQLEGKIENIMASNTPLSQIETDLVYIQKQIDKIINKSTSIDLAIDVISKISEELHQELAPEINESFGSILNNITNKYSRVMVTKDLDIKIEDPGYQRLLSVDNISLGTVDQVYFAFRLGLSKFLQGDDYPLILDEPFILYDENRLNNVLDYLVKNFKDRQIILFTSQKRELNILGDYAHTISLNDNTKYA